MKFDLIIHDPTPEQVFAIMTSGGTNRVSPPTSDRAAVSTPTLDERLAKLRARPFQHDATRQLVDLWKAMRATGEAPLPYPQVARRCGVGLAGFGQIVATVEHAAAPIFGMPFFERHDERVDGKKVTFYRPNPSIA